MNYGMRFVTLYRRQGSGPSPWKRNAKKQNGFHGVAKSWTRLRDYTELNSVKLELYYPQILSFCGCGLKETCVRFTRQNEALAITLWKVLQSDTVTEVRKGACRMEHVLAPQCSISSSSHCSHCWPTAASHLWPDTSDQIRSVAQLCPTLCDSMNLSTPGLPVHHQLMMRYVPSMPAFWRFFFSFFLLS